MQRTSFFSWLAIFLLSIFLSIFINPLQVFANLPINDAYRIFEEQKNKIEDAAIHFLDLNSQPNNSRYILGKYYYSDARASWNAWLETIIFQLQAGKKVEELDQQIEGLLKATEKTNIFLNHVWPPAETVISPSVIMGNLHPELASVVLSAVITIYEYWDHYRTAEKAREALLENLKNKKILAFDEMKKLWEEKRKRKKEERKMKEKCSEDPERCHKF